MPVLAILGAKDAMLDSAGTRAALERNAPNLDLRWLPAAGHMLTGHAATIAGFLKTALRP
jgi:pimeloyl-ACP methyl ester carboxylesterase